MRYLAALSALVLGVLLIAGLRGQSNRPTFHVSGQALPAVLASPTSIEGKVLNVSSTISILVIANTDTTSHTVTIQDGQTTAFKLFNAYTIEAGATWVVPLNGTRFEGGLNWSASDTKVMGTIVGEQ